MSYGVGSRYQSPAGQRLTEPDEVSDIYKYQVTSGFGKLWRKLTSGISDQSVIEQTFRDYISHHSVEECMSYIGVTRETVLRHMWRLGIPYTPKPLGGPRKVHYYQQLRESILQGKNYREYYENMQQQGYSHSQIARSLYMSYTTLRKIIFLLPNLK